LINKHFGQISLKNDAKTARSIPPPAPNWPKNKNRTVKIKRPESLQAAIKMGRLLFNRLHPDFYDVQILNTILGGYFGSRLMSNIREEKGYTYNIYSGIDTYYDHGYLYLATEVNDDKAGATLRAIKNEMRKLREQLVDEEELLMVRNYMMGALLNGMDGPLNMAALMRTMVFERAGGEGLDRQIAALERITPERVRALAQEYLRVEDFLTVVVTAR
jgi:zinc protease